MDRLCVVIGWCCVIRNLRMLSVWIVDLMDVDVFLCVMMFVCVCYLK